MLLISLIVVALVGAALVAVGVGLWWFPAGLIVGGLEMIGTAGIGAYLSAEASKR